MNSVCFFSTIEVCSWGKNMKIQPKIFTYDEVRDLVPRVWEITENYIEQVEGKRLAIADETSEISRDRIESEVETLFKGWTAEILKMGAEPKGLWLVDFDSGDGFYFCWKFPEKEVEYIHSYDGGFAGRRKIDWRSDSGK